MPNEVALSGISKTICVLYLLSVLSFSTSFLCSLPFLFPLFPLTSSSTHRRLHYTKDQICSCVLCSCLCLSCSSAALVGVSLSFSSSPYLRLSAYFGKIFSLRCTEESLTQPAKYGAIKKERKTYGRTDGRTPGAREPCKTIIKPTPCPRLWPLTATFLRPR